MHLHAYIQCGYNVEHVMPRTCISSALQRTNNESERKIERERERGTLWGTMNNGAAINWWKWAQIAKYILLFDNIQSLAINRNYNEFAICVCIHICMMWCPWAFWCVRLLYAYACLFVCVCVLCVLCANDFCWHIHAFRLWCASFAISRAPLNGDRRRQSTTYI